MCNIWKQKLDYQIQPQELDRALDNPLYSAVRTVGVNGGEPTLRKDLAEIIEILFRRLPRLETISLITNAFVPKKVISRIEETAEVIHGHKGRYDIMVSLDGVGAVHDRVRGRKNNFRNAVTVLDYLQTSGIADNLRLGCTVVRDNVYGLHDLHDFALERKIYIKYRIAIPHRRLYSDSLTAPFSLTPAEKAHFCIFLENLILHYEKAENQKFFYRSLIDQLMHGKARQAGCAWQHRGATISARGQLLYCAVQSKTLGSAVNENSERLYFGNVGHLAEIVRDKCDDCLHDYTGLPPGPVFLRHIVRELITRSGLPARLLDSHRLPLPVKQLGQQWRFRNRLRELGIEPNNTAPARKLPVGLNPNAPLRVLACGWYGTETLGDKTILAGVIQALRSRFTEISLQIASLEPYITKITVAQLPELTGATVVDIRTAVKLAPDADLVVFAGGPVMAVRSLADMLAILDRAAQHRVPALLAGCGVGPLGSRYQNRMIRRLLNLASVRIYRDSQSRNIAAELGVDTGSDLVAEDPAFTWITSRSSVNTPREDHEHAHESRILLGLREWPHHQYARGISHARARQIQAGFENAVLEGLQGVMQTRNDLKIVPFPMCTNHYGGDDRWFYRRLFRKSGQLASALDYSTLSRELSPDDALEIFRNARAILAMRFHSLVFALGLGTPAIACDYTMGKGKVAALADTAGVPYRSIETVDAGFITAGLLEALNAGTASRTPLPNRLTAAINNALDRLT